MYYVTRTMCEVLSEIRDLNKTRNYSSLLSLVEEIQSMGNRMEAAIGDKHSIDERYKEISRLKKEIKVLKAKKLKLKKGE